MCGPKFCSMKITQEVREFAEEPGRGRRGRAGRGLAAKAQEFKGTGASSIPHRQQSLTA